MHWMTQWASPYSLVVESASGARVRDVDGNEYVDFCLGDTGAMAGHSPPATVAAVEGQAARGMTAMLPTEDAQAVAEDSPAGSGSDLAVRSHRHRRQPLRAPARPSADRATKILVFNWCYHGSVDETVAISTAGGGARPGSVGPAVDPSSTTRDRRVERSRRARAGAGGPRCRLRARGAGADEHRDRAARARLPLRAARAHAAVGTLLVIDETHTICCGPGGYTRGVRPRP